MPTEVTKEDQIKAEVSNLMRKYNLSAIITTTINSEGLIHCFTDHDEPVFSRMTPDAKNVAGYLSQSTFQMVSSVMNNPIIKEFRPRKP